MISIDKTWDVVAPRRRQIPNDLICAIDIGSKNVKLVIGGNDDGHIWTRLWTKATLQLGADIRENEGRLGSQKLADLREVLSRFAEMGAAIGAGKMLAIATHAVRNAVNNKEVLDITRELGIDLDIADGEREGVIGYLAATDGEGGRIVSELGSRSCQVTWWNGAVFKSRCIDDMGYERAFACFIEPARDFADARNRYRDYLSGHMCNLPGSMQYVALASKSMAASVIGCDKDDAVGMKVHRIALEERISLIENMDGRHFDLMKSTLKKADKILSGMIFVEHILEASSSNDVLISEAELPVGLIVEYFSNRANRATRIEPRPVH
jgi:exopolyphosphatase/pppGpp-phosphohydrolase